MVQIAAGAYHSLARKTDGTVAAWGKNDFGQTNVPADLRDGLNNQLANLTGQRRELVRA